MICKDSRILCLECNGDGYNLRYILTDKPVPYEPKTFFSVVNKELCKKCEGKGRYFSKPFSFLDYILHKLKETFYATFK